jgi:hypothetical protein
MQKQPEITRVENKILAYDPGKEGKVFVGKIDGKYFKREVKKSHYFVKNGGYSLQKTVIKYLLNWTNVKYVLMRSERYIHKSKLTDWKEHGDHINEGHGSQICLNLKYVKKKKRKS